MPLSAGDRLGPYEIVEPLGAGGMGEVYRARDAKLNRDVAIKVLPAALANDAQYMARFEREAQMLAALNHPNVATVYGIERGALVMELVDGADLKGPLPIEEAIAIARQIAAGLEAAHEKGIIHRDLKPANIKLTSSGVVKILDFGLAKSAEASAARAGSNATMSPTLSLEMTRAGMILGTAAYMSPEQARGKVVDKRTDIWAFGVVLYEIITGKRLFEGEDLTETLASVVKERPDLSGVPVNVRRLLERCLEKDPKKRLRDIGDMELLLAEALAAPSPPATLRSGKLPWIAAAVAGVVAAGLALVLWRQPKPDARQVRFTVSYPEGSSTDFSGSPALSPDGNWVVFVSTVNGKRSLWLRSLNATESRPIPETDGAYAPFWSPDSRYLAFYMKGGVFKLDLAGGHITKICESAERLDFRGAWGADNQLILTQPFGGLMRVNANGGVPVPLLPLDKTRGELSQIFPMFLPDGRHFIYFSRTADQSKGGVFAASIDSLKPQPLLAGAIGAVATPPRSLAFVRQSTLFVQPFNARNFRMEGEPAAVVQNVGTYSYAPVCQCSFSNNGILAFRSQVSGDNQLQWRNADGKRLGAVGNPGKLRQFSLSPDGKRVVIEVLDTTLNTRDLWLLELGSGIFSRFTFDPKEDSDPIWTADSKAVVFASDRRGTLDLYRKIVGGGDEELILEDKDRKVPEWALKDGTVLYTTTNGRNMYLLPPNGERKGRLIFQRPFVQDEPHVSPDGRWIAYSSQESGRWEVYAASFPSFSGIRQVSNGGGGEPQWRGDGKEMYYLSLDGNIVAVDVKAGATIETGVPRVLFQTGIYANPFNDQYAVTADGKRFLILEPLEQAIKPMTVVLNWDQGIARR